MTLDLVNHKPAAYRSIDQYAVKDENDKIIGGFSLALTADEALLMGFHLNRHIPLGWIFEKLRELYPHITRLTGYRATGRHTGHVTWVAEGTNGWRREKGQ